MERSRCNITKHRFMSSTAGKRIQGISPFSFDPAYFVRASAKSSCTGQPCLALGKASWDWDGPHRIPVQSPGSTQGPALALLAPNKAMAHICFIQGMWPFPAAQSTVGSHRAQAAPALAQVHVQALLYQGFKSIVLDGRSTLHFITSQHLNIKKVILNPAPHNWGCTAPPREDIYY